MEWLIGVISAFISGGFSLAVCLVNNNAQLRKRDIEQDKHIEEIKTEFNKQVTDVKNEMQRQMTDVKNELHEQIMELSAAYQQSVAVITVKIDDLDKKQSIHNGVIERVYKLESDQKVTDEKIKVANNRILDLERTAKA